MCTKHAYINKIHLKIFLLTISLVFIYCQDTVSIKEEETLNIQIGDKWCFSYYKNYMP